MDQRKRRDENDDSDKESDWLERTGREGPCDDSADSAMNKMEQDNRNYRDEKRATAKSK